MTDYPITTLTCPACRWAFEYALPPEAGQVRCKNTGQCGRWHPLAALTTRGLVEDTGQTTPRPDLRRWWKPAPTPKAPPPAPDPTAAAIRLLHALPRRPKIRKRRTPPQEPTS
jgi:hypothetical protein